MIQSNHSISENLKILKFLIELKNLGLNVSFKDEKYILSIKIKDNFFMSQDDDLDLSIKKLINNIINY